MNHHYCIECDKAYNCTVLTVFGDNEKPSCFAQTRSHAERVAKVGHCNKCQHSIYGGWFCLLLYCYTEPSGPNYVCGSFDLRREFQ